MTDMILYSAEDGQTRLHLRVEGHNVWLSQQQELTLDFWRSNVDKMLAFNDQPILQGADSVNRDRMEQVSHERYELFDQQRRNAKCIQADADDLKEIEQFEHSLKNAGKKP